MAGPRSSDVARRVVADWAWAFLVWVLLTWTRTWSQVLFGLGFSLFVAAVCAALGPAAGPWRLLHPRRIAVGVHLAASALVRILRANISLARRIWLPSRPLRPGMVIVPTDAEPVVTITAVGLITSVIVDFQIVDVDLSARELQYHAVWVDSEDPEENRARINGPIERPLLALADRASTRIGEP